jgi:anti-sigma factor RsiW
MDHQVLDRLLTDRAVGRLDDDAAALLTDYLAEHSELQARAESIEETVQLAERAFQSRGTDELPTLDRHRMERSRRLSRHSRWFRQTLAVAAALVVGATTVLMTRPTQRFIPQEGSVATRGSIAIEVYPSAQPISDENFWSLEHVSTASQVRSAVRYTHPSGNIQQAIRATF